MKICALISLEPWIYCWVTLVKWCSQFKLQFCHRQNKNNPHTPGLSLGLAQNKVHKASVWYLAQQMLYIVEVCIRKYKSGISFLVFIPGVQLVFIVSLTAFGIT